VPWASTSPPSGQLLKLLSAESVETGRWFTPRVDHFGLDRRGAEPLCQVLTERKEKNSVAIGANESFSGWTKIFPAPRLCAAIVDRLTPTARSSEQAPNRTGSPTPEPKPNRPADLGREAKRAVRWPENVSSDSFGQEPDPSCIPFMKYVGSLGACCPTVAP
jgi:hypothetical protein